MKRLISFLFLIFSFYYSPAQTNFVGKTHQQVKSYIIDNFHLEIMESDWDYIHIVDNNNFRNIIFYFENDTCDFVITTFQDENDFLKQINYFNMNFRNFSKNSWLVPTEEEGLYHYIKSNDEVGYDFIEESIISDNDLEDLN